MKNPTDDGFDQYYNAQAAVDQDRRLIVGHSLSNHPNNKAEASPTVDAIPAEVGTPKAAVLDNGYFSPATVDGLAVRVIESYVATRRAPPHQSCQEHFAAQPNPPAADATLIEQMAYKLRTTIGKLIYGLCKSTVEPVSRCGRRRSSPTRCAGNIAPIATRSAWPAARRPRPLPRCGIGGWGVSRRRMGMDLRKYPNKDLSRQRGRLSGFLTAHRLFFAWITRGYSITSQATGVN